MQANYKHLCFSVVMAVTMAAGQLQFLQIIKKKPKLVNHRFLLFCWKIP